MSRLLLVEDDRMLGDALAAALVQDGWQIDRAEDVATARLALVDHGYTAVLLDLGLPHGSGLDVLMALRQRGGQRIAQHAIVFNQEQARHRVVLGVAVPHARSARLNRL